MALFKNKWEIKTWADLSASVADASNALEFRPVHRLPLALQQGPKASKKVGGFFKRESVLKAPDYPAGFYIYDADNGVSYTATPKENFKTDMTEFLNSSSLSSAAKSAISTSFNGTNWPSLVVQMDSSSFTGSVTGSGPASAAWSVPVAFIGNGAGTLQTIDQSTNHTGIALQAAGTYAGAVSSVEFTLPMETMSFTGTYESRSLEFASFTGSEYSPTVYANSAIYTPNGSPQTTASIIGVQFGSGSYVTESNGNYPWVEYGGYIKALGDGLDGIYDYGTKKDILHFQASSVVTSSVFTHRYALSDTNMIGFTAAPGTVYYVSGSLTSTGSEHFFDNSNGAVIMSGGSGSHLFLDQHLSTPAAEGIYRFAGLTNTKACQVKIPSETGARIPRFSGIKYNT